MTSGVGAGLNRDSGWADDPIQDSTSDLLGRASLAKNIAEFINSTYTPDSSLVFGMAGPWGSGKSSMLNLIRQHLEATSTATAKWAFSEFNPWATESVPGLLAEFEASLNAALPAEVKKDRTNRIRLKRWAKAAFRVAEEVPYGGGLARIAAEAMEDEKPFDQVFADNAEIFRNANVRVMIVVDDVDRLHRDELPALLKVIRLVGRFPGVNYLLAYDEQTLTENIMASGIGGDTLGRARLFMEKIVQYQFSVPPLRFEASAAMLEARAFEVFRSLGRPLGKEQESRFLDAMQDFLRVLSTPRSVARYLGHLRLDLLCTAPGEVDDADLALLTFVRIHAPNAFQVLPSFKSILTSPGPKEDLKRAIAGENEAIRAVLENAFPTIAGADSRKTGVSDPEYFDRYFSGISPGYDLPDEIVRRSALVASLTGKHEDLALILHSNDEASHAARTKLDRIIDPSRTIKDPNDIPLTPRLLAAILAMAATMESGALHWLVWAGDAIATLSETGSLEELAVVLKAAPKRFIPEVLSYAAYAATGGQTREVPDVLKGLGREFEYHFLETLLDDISMQDLAPQGWLGYQCFECLSIYGDAVRVRQLLQEAISAGRFSPDDVAARFVTSRGMRLHLDNDLLREFLDPRLVSLPPGPAHPSERSWGNRRLTAMASVDRAALA